ncbi:PAS domain S-box protein [Methanosarcina hadiensis]|uniref:PAS domain S-box protein n=1 Tax=Methanosarcina hadiensis TaxID=3078083 RepID=UPI0039772B13
MENIQKLPFTKKSNELLVILVAGFIFILAASSYDTFDSIVLFVESHYSKGLGFLLILSIYISFGMGLFSLIRWIERENTLALYRKAEGDLKRKDRTYRALFEKCNDAVIISDGKKVLDINLKGCEIFGFEQKYPFHTSLMSLIPGEYLPDLQQAINHAFKQDSSHFDMKYQKPGGEAVDIRVSLSFIDRKDSIIQIIAQDVTFKKSMEKYERESLERLQVVIDNTLCGILLIEASSMKIIDANPAALRTAGYSGKELIGMLSQNLVCQPREEECPALSLDHAGDLSEGVLIKATGESLPVLRNIVPVSTGGKGYFVESFISREPEKS